MAAHLGIRDAVAALYAADTALAGDRIYANRDYALAIGVPSQIHVHRVRSAPVDQPIYTGAPIDWITEIRTVVLARKDDATSAEDVADAILVACFARVMADQTLGGLAMQLQPGAIEWDQDEADSNVAQATWDISVMHRTTGNVI